MAVGFTCQLLLVTFTVWSGSAEALVPAHMDCLSPATTRLRSCSFFITFFAGAFAAYRRPQLFGARLAACTAAVLIMGVLCQLAFRAAPFASLALLASVLMGMGTAVFFLLWENLFARERLAFVGLCLGFAMCVSGALYALLFVIPGRDATLLALAVLTTALLLHSYREPVDESWHPRPAVEPRRLFADIWPTLLCAAAIYFVSAATRAATLGELVDNELFDAVSMMSMVLSGLLLMLFWGLLHSRIDLEKVYQAVFPIVATGFLVLPFLGEAFHVGFVALTFLVASIIASLIMLTSIQVSRRSGLAPTFIYGVLSGSCYCASFVGSLAGDGVRLMDDFGFAQMLIVSFVCLYILSMALLALKKRGAKAAGADASPGAVDTIPRSGRASTADGSGPHSTEASLEGTDEGDSLDMFDRACNSLAQDCGLSRRESEIMHLLARGRDLPTISKTLFISRSTVQTHSKSLYRKLDIHSKQELIDLVETTAHDLQVDTDTR